MGQKLGKRGYGVLCGRAEPEDAVLMNRAAEAPLPPSPPRSPRKRRWVGRVSPDADGNSDAVVALGYDPTRLMAVGAGPAVPDAALVNPLLAPAPAVVEEDELDDCDIVNGRAPSPQHPALPLHRSHPQRWSHREPPDRLAVPPPLHPRPGSFPPSTRVSAAGTACTRGLSTPEPTTPTPTHSVGASPTPARPAPRSPKLTERTLKEYRGWVHSLRQPAVEDSDTASEAEREDLSGILPEDLSGTLPDVRVALTDHAARCPSELSITAGAKLLALRTRAGWTLAESWTPSPEGEAQIGWVPAGLCVPAGTLDAMPWYFGVLSRADAERILREGHVGTRTFLVRTSANAAFHGAPRIVVSVMTGPRQYPSHYAIGTTASAQFQLHGRSYLSVQELVESEQVWDGGIGSPCDKAPGVVAGMMGQHRLALALQAQRGEAGRHPTPSTPPNNLLWWALRRLECHQPRGAPPRGVFEKSALERPAGPSAVLQAVSTGGVRARFLPAFIYTYVWINQRPTFTSRGTGLRLWRDGERWLIGAPGRELYQLAAETEGRGGGGVDPNIPPPGEWVCGRDNPHSEAVGAVPPAAYRFRLVLDPEFVWVLLDNRRWTLTGHTRLHPGIREFVTTVMLCARRLAQIHNGERKWAPARRTGDLPDFCDRRSVLLHLYPGVEPVPPLPLEMWLAVLELLRQGDMLS
eukprot:m.127304 g.127304  ORF g.127304 m.127304 type:complete len:692 (+) comp13595_c0_seq1:200-2275(+)